jgi:hypothetical protein
MAISSHPGVETPGYFSRNAGSLWDGARAVSQKLSCARNVFEINNRWTGT